MAALFAQNLKKCNKISVVIMFGCVFNINNGFLEGLCRGMRCGVLKDADYMNLVQCETLEGNFICF